MGTLTVIGQKLFHIKIDGMIIGLNTENRVGQLNFPAGFLSLDINYVQFHYFSIIKYEPLGPGTDPLTIKRLFSGITLTTLRFSILTRLPPVRPAILMPLNTLD